MKYEVRCACGKAHAVSAADAGASLPCACGEQVDVPPLHQLRAAVGELSGSPELMLCNLLENGELPDTPECAGCSQTTQSVVWVELLYPKPDDPDRLRLAAVEAAGCIAGFISAIADVFVKPEPKRPPDHEILFRIPVRCCPACARTIKKAGLRASMRRQPVCAAVLDRYSQLVLWREK